MTAQDARYQPLADELEQAVNAIRNYDTDQVRESVARVEEPCADR